MVDTQTPPPVSQTLSVANMIRAQYGSERLSLPLSGGTYVGFEHVEGVPSNTSDGYSIYRLKLVDLMIERLSTGYDESAARQDLSSVTQALRQGESALADSVISDRGGSTRAFLMNMIV